MLDLVAELAHHPIRDVARVLGHKEDPDPLGADQLDRLLDPLQKVPGSIVKKHVRLVEEEDQLRLVQVPGLGQHLVQLRQHIQKKRRIHIRIHDQLPAVQDRDHPAAAVLLQKVLHVQSRLPEEPVRSLRLKRHDRAQDRRQSRLRDTPVGRLILFRMLAHIIQHGLQVLRIDQKEPRIIGDLKNNTQNIGLNFI